VTVDVHDMVFFARSFGTRTPFWPAADRTMPFALRRHV
jgi:hypothetical protein